MPRHLQPQRLNMRALAQEGESLQESTPLVSLERLAGETQALQADAVVNWEAHAELRPHPGAEDDVWLHLQAGASVPLTCQRCMGVVMVPVEVDQWFRFVENEEIAMAEDDAAEEDLLVIEPQFDLLAVIEDELLMALPLVPMHGECPDGVKLPKSMEVPEPLAEKPNPFAVLAQMKGKK